MIIYFTGTGNSRYIAEALADRLCDETIDAGKLIKDGISGEFNSEKPYIFCFPCYLSTIPKIFADFIRTASFFGDRRVYAVGTCKSSIGISGEVVRRICVEKDLDYHGSTQVLMPQNYIALFKMTEPEEIDLRLKNALLRADEISEVVKNNSYLEMKRPSRAEVIAVKLVEKMYIGPFTGTRKFRIDEKCIGCGLCAKKCPTNHVHMVEGKPVWDCKSCVHCMACINRCPVAAIEYGKGTLGKKRYTCKEYLREY